MSEKIPNQRASGSASPTNLTERLWVLFGSMKFAVWTLVAAALLSLIALLLSELLPLSVRLSLPARVFQLEDPFRSWWFRLLLSVLALSLLVCIIQNGPALFRQAFKKTFYTQPAHFIGRPGFQRLSLERGEQAAQDLLRRLKLKVHRREVEGGTAFLGARGGWSRIGPFFGHLGMLALILGGLAAGLTGKSEQVAGGAGDTLTRPEWDFKLLINDFTIKYYPISLNQWVEIPGGMRGQVTRMAADSALVRLVGHSGRTEKRWFRVDSLDNAFLITQNGRMMPYTGNVQSYITTASALRGEQVLFQRPIEVNRPLRFCGFRFYQSSFDLSPARTRVDSLHILCRKADGEETEVLLAIGDSAKIFNDVWAVHLTRFLPDFRIGADRQAFSVSEELRNPAARLELKEKDKDWGGVWVFSGTAGSMGHRELPVKFTLTDFKGMQVEPERYITILKVHREYGRWLIWFGLAVMTGGLLLTYSATQRRVWMLIQTNRAGKDDIFLAASSSRLDSSFFERLMREAERLQYKN